MRIGLGQLQGQLIERLRPPRLGFHAGGLRYHGMAPLVSHLHRIRDLDAKSTAIVDGAAVLARVVADAQAQEQFEKNEIYSCNAEREVRYPDPLYTVRAWRGVLTYLLRRHEFLYE
mgnify:CR=1 FL=1